MILYDYSKCESVSCSVMSNSATPWTVACQASLSMEFSRQEFWSVAHQAPLCMRFSRQEYYSGLPCPPPGDLLHPGTEPGSPVAPAIVGRFFTTEPPGKLPWNNICPDDVWGTLILSYILYSFPVYGDYALAELISPATTGTQPIMYKTLSPIYIYYQ